MIEFPAENNPFCVSILYNENNFYVLHDKYSNLEIQNHLLITFYKNYRADIADPNSELFKMKQEFEIKQKIF